MKAIDIFIEDKVWGLNLKYVRMMRKTKEKFFEYLKAKRPLEDYKKGIKELWNIDHSFMDETIKELEKMVTEMDIKTYEEFEKVLTKQMSEKLTNGKLYYKVQDKTIYPLNPESDFRKIEQKYVNDHIKYYQRNLEIINKVPDENAYLDSLVEKYDKLDKTIPYYYKDGTIKCYNTVATYNSMLYNWNLTHAAWNRTEYDGQLLENNLRYLPAHPHACEMCSEYQGYVYAVDTPTKAEEKILSKYGKRGEHMKEDAVAGGVGHPNCKHVWTLFWDEAQIQEEKYNSEEDIEEYKTIQKIQSLDLEKSRLLSDRRIYKSLGDEGKVDELTTKIKAIRDKKKELE